MSNLARTFQSAIGYAFLLIACGFLCAWTRSNWYQDSLMLPHRNCIYHLISRDGTIGLFMIWSTVTEDFAEKNFDRSIESMPLEELWKGVTDDERYEFTSRQSVFQRFGFDFETGETPHHNLRNRKIDVPYWFLIVPQIVFSVWLLGNRSRNMNHRPTTEQEQEKAVG